MDTFSQKKILIIFTGGTVAGHVAKNDANQNATLSSNSFLGLVETAVETIKKNWSIEIAYDVAELFSIDSSSMLPLHWTKIIDTIHERYDFFDAFVILHGTNTMGYSCAALSFALENINKPVIFTGAQVPLGYIGSDAAMNLVNSLRLSVWAYHPIKGVMAVFGSKIITGTRVKKGTDFDYDPFSSFHVGSIGQIGRFVRVNSVALERHISYLSKSKTLAVQSRMLSVKKEFDTEHIASLTEFPGMSPTLFQSLVENAGIKAFVFRAFGAGDPNPRLYPAFEYLKEKQIPIVITTQAANGIASMQVNESGVYLREHELAIPAHDMSIESMTTKLGWLLGQKKSYDEISSIMLQDLHGEINVEVELT